MTRKEVCKATGLTVKTLRLYEEKGLIVPAKERRNGREYREYTPELVEQLKQIVTLRRAMFTMDEIKTMQERADSIPGIFRDYQLWLEGQERQFHLLRQAAEKISEQDLGSLEGLLSGLENAAEQLPLPAMDVKPNFKRLDEMEEEPRHVAPQVNFDETVPDAKVFRQMNIVMDGDRANNVNIAFGQLGATREAFAQPTGSGIVQREPEQPKWYQMLSRIVNSLLISCVVFSAFCLIIGSRQPFILYATGILFVIRLAMMGIPVWLEHRAWLKQAQQEDYDRQQKRFATDAGGYAKERRRKRKIVLLSVAGGLVVIALIAVLTRVLYVQAHPATDYRVCFASPANIFDEDLRAMEQVLAPLVGDRDGNGKVVVDVELMYVTESQIAPISNGTVKPAGYLAGRLSTGNTDCREWEEYGLYLIPDLEVNFYNLCDEIKFSQNCAKLPDDLRELPGSTDYRVNLTGTKLFAAAGLKELPVYGCIALGATQEEYDQAVALLREILAQ